MLMFIPARSALLNPFFPQVKSQPRGPLGAGFLWGLTDRLVQAALFLADSDLGPPTGHPPGPDSTWM